MTELEHKINNILANWNPIGVDEFIADEEYRDYISPIIECLNDKKELTKCLIYLLTVKMGLSFDVENVDHIRDMEGICNKLLNLGGSL